MTVRWHLSDPTDPATGVGSLSTGLLLEVNPNAGGTPGLAKTITEQGTAAPGGPTMLFEGADVPPAFEFSGTLLSQSEHDRLVTYAAKRRQVLVRDDLGREFWIYITSVDLTRTRARHSPWKHTWRMTAVKLDWATDAGA